MSETQYCTPLLVSGDNVSVLERIPISDGSYNEAYIQNLAFAHPSCLPISELDRSYEGLIPVCKELNTPAGPLDILYVTPQGRLVIVEAKLWRNPMARRKVIGQILDYAKELSGWDYQDLQREISRATGRKGNVDLIVYEGKRTDFFGHSYFQTNPRVSADVIELILNGTAPGEPRRPLVRIGKITWTFPER
jgi:hypothetical protein